jgi:hypothetical protein
MELFISGMTAVRDADSIEQAEAGVSGSLEFRLSGGVVFCDHAA